MCNKQLKQRILFKKKTIFDPFIIIIIVFISLFLIVLNSITIFK